jgi:nitronate monooxygenase
MKLFPLNIGDLKALIPIIQGGMGVGVSGSRLASAVANEGGVGIISGVQIGYKEPDFNTNPLNANIRALINEIKTARQLSPNGIIGVNFLCAMNNYNEMVGAAVKEGIDLIISGAGLPTNLPELIDGYKTKIAPIVSSGKAARIISKLWDNKYGKCADLIIVEGPEAGGHLGYSEETLNSSEKPRLTDIIKDVIETIKPYEEKYNKKIPVIAAGGIYNGSDIAKYLNLGASGVQMATRFVATNECDADIKFKEAYLDSKEEDIIIIKSPVGMPGRALNNNFIKKINICNESIKGCYLCLKGCNPKVAPYCISKALIKAVSGDVDEGLVFVGSNAYKLNKIISVKELINELINEAELCFGV